MDMVAKKSFNAAKMRRDFLERAWEILMRYLEKLDEDKIINATDARAGAGVVKTLLEAAEKAGEGAPDEEEDLELPKIPEAILDEIIAKINEQEALERAPRKAGRASKSALPHPAAAEC